jgi:hypothetical protein
VTQAGIAGHHGCRPARSHRPELADFLAFSLDTPSGEPSQRVDVSLNGVDFPVTHGWESTPAASFAGKYPVVLFSPGYGLRATGDREQGAALLEDSISSIYKLRTFQHLRRRSRHRSLLSTPGRA